MNLSLKFEIILLWRFLAHEYSVRTPVYLFLVVSVCQDLMFEIEIIEKMLIVPISSKSTMCVYYLFFFFSFLPKAVTKNDLQPPSYYEVMEFDPLAPAVTTE